MATDRGARWALAASLLAVGLVVLPSPAQARPARAEPSEPSILEVVGPDPVLDDVSVVADGATRSADRRLTDRRADAAAAARALADAEHNRAQVAVQSLDAAAAVTRSQIAVAAAVADTRHQGVVLTRREAVTNRRRALLAAEQDQLRILGVSLFISKPLDDTMFLGSFEEMSVGSRRQALRGQVVADQTVATDHAERRWRVARGAGEAQQRRVDRAVAAERRARHTLGQNEEHRQNLAAFERRADASVVTRRTSLDRAEASRLAAQLALRKARLVRPVRGLDLTLVALHAYGLAAAASPCAVPWWVLAGVGRVETRHGTAQGAELLVDGTDSKRIVGIALDGRPGVGLVSDTDGGQLDGDPHVDRAVGPMQFIPGTWRRWALDGNGDGQKDPSNIYDAAAAAANYLCFGHPSLADEASQRRALRSYNNSGPYGTHVLEQGRRYRDALDLPAPPTPLPTP